MARNSAASSGGALRLSCSRSRSRSPHAVVRRSRSSGNRQPRASRGGDDPPRRRLWRAPAWLCGRRAPAADTVASPRRGRPPSLRDSARLHVAKVDIEGTSPFTVVDPQAAMEFGCAVCLGPLEHPTQVICDEVDEGHRACLSCLEQIMARNRRCPVCNVACRLGVKDGLVERRMQAVEVKCDGCSWNGPWHLRMDHALACEAIASRLRWRCPVAGCAFSSTTEREVEVHLLAGFQDHLELARPLDKVPPLHPTFACKDTAQVYIPDLAAFHSRGNSIESPVFLAAGGYCCLVTVEPKSGEGIGVKLRFHPDLCPERAAPFPFERPFSVMMTNPDDQAICTQVLVDFHITAPERFEDCNINPRRSQQSWTGGVEHIFLREDVHALNLNNIIVKLTVL